jgi:hypothetical protein
MLSETLTFAPYRSLLDRRILPAIGSKPLARLKACDIGRGTPHYDSLVSPVRQDHVGWGEAAILDRQWRVDAKPGRYKTQVPQDSSNCYWERLKDDRGGFDSIIANDKVNPGARVSITVRSGEFFKLKRLRHLDEGLTIPSARPLRRRLHWSEQNKEIIFCAGDSGSC